ncbi:MAG: NapC/NirT family cytochrome c [Planctomycetota bacterium]
MKFFWKKIRLLALFTVIIFIFLLLLSIYGYYYWSQPEFCNSCHIMKPYYKAWAVSTHKNVACVKCHFEPGIENELRGKWLAIKQLASFLTGSYSSKPYAEISDKSCLRSGCHS